MALLGRVLIVLGVALTAFVARPAWCDSPVAPLNGTVAFPSASAQSDTLYVDAGESNVKATRAQKFQGNPDSRITLVNSPGSGQVHVADVTLRDGDSLYRVYGYYLGGTGGTQTGWKAEYNRGVTGRIIL